MRATSPSSVVQTGVKFLGWENSTPQPSPSHSWNEIVLRGLGDEVGGLVTQLQRCCAPIHLLLLCFVRTSWSRVRSTQAAVPSR